MYENLIIFHLIFPFFSMDDMASTLVATDMMVCTFVQEMCVQIHILKFEEQPPYPVQEKGYASQG